MNSVVSGEVKWQPYSDARLAELQQNQQPVLIDFTASWCLSCKVNERVAFTEAVKKKIEELGIVPLKADWTNRDPVIAQALERYGRNSVPLYVLYDGKTLDPHILPEIITENIVLDALSNTAK